MKGIWKDVVGFEGLYEVSNFGQIKGLEKVCKAGIKNNPFIKKKERIMKQYTGLHGYMTIGLKKGEKHYTRTVHSLVWESFVGDYPKKNDIYQIDHIDGNKCNNNIENLQLLTRRENTAKSVIKSGKLTGAFKNGNNWTARISINNKLVNLGTFQTQLEAHLAYNNYKINHK